MSRWAVALVALSGCAQFRPPSKEAGGTPSSPGTCAAPGDAYSYADEKGSTVAGDGLHIAGKLAAGDDVFAGVGLGFADPGPPLDASRYQGIVFAARRSPGSVAHIRLKVPDANTDPAGGVCTDCYNDFGLPFQVTEEWTRFEVRFDDLVQETGWGSPRPEAVERSKLYGVQWQVAAAGAEYELWIDDVGFLGCGE